MDETTKEGSDAESDEGMPVAIGSRDYWFKIVGFLQQNWALIDPTPAGVKVWFVSDSSGVFDDMTFTTETEAAAGLRRNGFSRLEEDDDAQETLGIPEPPFRRAAHPNGRIYSSARFWK